MEKIKVFIKAGYCTLDLDNDKWYTFKVNKKFNFTDYQDIRQNDNRYALVKLPHIHTHNPGGYVFAPLFVLSEEDLINSQIWDAELAKPFDYRDTIRIVKMYCKYAWRASVWFFISNIMQTRIQRERLMYISSIIDEQDTLYHKYSPHNIRRQIVNYLNPIHKV